MDIRERLDDLSRFYRNHLVDDVLPFFLKHALDREHSGYTTCLDNNGTLLSGDKYLWSQGRGLWTFSAVYNRLDAQPEYLEAARLGARFLTKFGRDQQGSWVYRSDQAGGVLDGPLSAYVDMFAVYGLTEYFRATGDLALLKLAYETLVDGWRRMQDPQFDAVYPYSVPVGWRAHGPAMITLETAGELARSVDAPQLEAIIDEAVSLILEYHYKPKYGVILENVTRDGDQIDSPQGHIVNPGHTVESAWFLIHWAQRQGKDDVVVTACDLIRKALEIGWDEQYGGVFHGVDLAGGPSEVFDNADCKPWWISTEAMYALLLVYELTGESWASQWYCKVEQWAIQHHCTAWGDWYQRLDRTGKPITTVIGLPVKDPYHLPRTLILGHQALERMAGRRTKHDPFDELDRVPLAQLSS